MTDNNVHELPAPPRTVEQIRADIDAERRAEADAALASLVARSMTRAKELRENPPTRDDVRHAVKCWRGEGTEI